MVSLCPFPSPIARLTENLAHRVGRPRSSPPSGLGAAEESRDDYGENCRLGKPSGLPSSRQAPPLSTPPRVTRGSAPLNPAPLSPAPRRSRLLSGHRDLQPGSHPVEWPLEGRSLSSPSPLRTEALSWQRLIACSLLDFHICGS